MKTEVCKKRSFQLNLLKGDEHHSMKGLSYKISVEGENKRWKNIPNGVKGLFLKEMTVIPNH